MNKSETSENQAPGLDLLAQLEQVHAELSCNRAYLMARIQAAGVAVVPANPRPQPLLVRAEV